MVALVEDATAMAIGMFISIAVSLFLCVLSVALISWSALRQVQYTIKLMSIDKVMIITLFGTISRAIKGYKNNLGQSKPIDDKPLFVND